jgi:hypothetical protein
LVDGLGNQLNDKKQKKAAAAFEGSGGFSTNRTTSAANEKAGWLPNSITAVFFRMARQLRQARPSGPI